jgi:putative two-component system response regulator
MLQKQSCAAAQVLVVDNDENVLSLLSEELARSVLKVYAARSGEQALELARERRIDLVLCDLYLQGMTGHHFARAVVRMHPQIPVVILAAWNDPESRRHCLESGASDVLTKPLDLSKLPDVVEDNLRRRKLDRERLTSERAEVFFTAIKAIAGAIDAKSSYAVPHTDRVAELALKIAAELRLPEEDICALELAVYTRDIGKIDTPDTVLTKPGALSEVEWVDVL